MIMKIVKMRKEKTNNEKSNDNKIFALVSSQQITCFAEIRDGPILEEPVAAR